MAFKSKGWHKIPLNSIWDNCAVSVSVLVSRRGWLVILILVVVDAICIEWRNIFIKRLSLYFCPHDKEIPTYFGLWTKQRTVGENVEKCFTLLYSASLTCGGRAGYKREARRGWVSWVQTLIHFVHNPSHRYCVSNNCYCYSNYAKNVRGKIRKHIT